MNSVELKIEYLNRVISGLTKQGCLSRSSASDSCYYRMGGNKCALGLLISDEHYSIQMEGHALNYLVNEGLQKSGIDTSIGIDFFAKLQQIHDNAPDLESALFQYKHLKEQYEATGSNSN